MTKVLNHSAHSFVYVVATSCIALSLLVALAMPTPARAAQLNETQIQAILNLLVAFDADPATITNTEAALRGSASTTPSTDMSTTTDTSTSNSSTTPPVIPPPSPCGLPGQTLERGDRGEEVGTLQNFLVSQGLLASSSITRFFGPITEDALKHWQAQQGLVATGDANSTGWGVFGPKTRSVIARLCNPSESDNKSFENKLDLPRPAGDGEHRTGSTTVNDITPSCTLAADQASVAPGATVTLTWESTNAIYASSPQGPNKVVNGSVTVTPTTTTVYQKTVYGAGGSASCQTTVAVASTASSTDIGSTTPSGIPATIQVMAQPDINLASAVMAVAQFPFSLAVDSLANIFIELGVGQ